jgi:hypothetical protein
MMGRYIVVDERRKWACLDREQWKQHVFPGSKLSLSIVLAELRTTPGKCPRNQNHKVSANESSAGGPYTWSVLSTPSGLFIVITNPSQLGMRPSILVHRLRLGWQAEPVPSG